MNNVPTYTQQTHDPKDMPPDLVKALYEIVTFTIRGGAILSDYTLHDLKHESGMPLGSYKVTVEKVITGP